MITSTLEDFPTRTTTNNAVPVAIERSCANVRVNQGIPAEDILTIPNLQTSVLKSLTYSDVMPLDDVSDQAVDRYECGKRSVKLCFQDNSGCTEAGNQVQNVLLDGAYIDLQLV